MDAAGGAADTYVTALEEALGQKRVSLDTKVLPQMLDTFRLLLATFEGSYALLLRKGLIREDPYKLEDRCTDITVPPRDRFGPAQLAEQMSVRLSRYHTQIEYVINYVEFKVDYLNLARLKQLAGLMRYIDFANLTEVSPSATTGGLAVLVDHVVKGSDHVAAGVLKDTVAHLADLVRQILKGVADVVLYQREAHKLELRRVATGLPQPVGPDELAAAARAAGLPEHPELATEVLAEDYPQDPAVGAELRAKVLARLGPEKKKEEKIAKGPTPRDLLQEALRHTAEAEAPLRSALKAVRDNEEVVSSRPASLFERLARFLARAAGVRERDKVYEVEYLDDGRGDTHVERIAWSQFLAEASSRIKTLHGLGQRSGSEHERLEASTDEEVFTLLTRVGVDLSRLCRRLDGLAALFRSRIPPVHRSLFRGVHGDLTMIRNAMNKANKKKHEYVSRMEEEEQFRKLGIAKRP